MLKAVIFDIDGTLIDSVELHAQAWHRAFMHFERQVPIEEIRKQIGKGSDQLLPVFFTVYELERFGADLERYRGELYKREFLPKVKPFPRVRELLLRIREDGPRIALASSARNDELSYYKRLMNVEDLVEESVSADKAARSKPHPDIFSAALRELGDVHGDEAVAVGDTPYDAAAASDIHMRTIGILGGVWPEEKLREAGCIEVFRSPADLLERFEHSALAESRAA
ncbi:MAG: Phosphoglycolate phosphatase [Candidatus Angelobacter sp.]|jgi:HAD superfamily hydrolase (TIGR01509 family)|nr:Phosphoglycolate phosphatase [Candidatus Angelobacter sp.]